MAEQADYMFKIILLGSSGVGKSNILLRFTRDKFSENHQMTVGVQFAAKTVQANGKKIKLQIWDTLGQQQYKAIMRTFYKGASAAILVYDIINQKSFEDIQYWYKQIQQYSKSQIVIMLVGNKSDIQNLRAVSKQKGFQYAENKKIAFYQVSAKQGTNINLIFLKIAQELQKLMTQAQKIKNSNEQNSKNQNQKQIKQETKAKTLKKSIVQKPKEKKTQCCN